MIVTDSPPADVIDNPIESDGLACIVCGTGLTYGGRGPKPKYCDEHRKQPKTTGVPRQSGKTVDSLVESIKDTYRQAGMILAFIPKPGYQADGMVLSTEADKLGESWRPLLERDEAIRKMWNKFFQVSGWGALIGAHAMIALPIMQNHGLIKRPVDVVPPTVQTTPGNDGAGFPPFAGFGGES